ncbi:hypothetical protein [Methanothermococcus okinawensis]|uniref:Uncharacterized protein n=1 Tax=Methanothermococcus okinawensis (strain DSM 14208 / JCM 11175 / IH1) TaxID=647113 RepID=F8AMN3_METOI|nr:hypothetical protein [Methanothermococcus okinawensis]AEH06864.1 hypothetical protein Metok_0891 [Methanothermococcus okinawensis IH1]
MINNIINDNYLAIFNNAQFLNKNTKIENFSLSKTSFLKTDVREVMLLCGIKKEEILSHKLLKFKEYLLLKDVDEELSNIYSGKYNDDSNLNFKIQKLLLEIGNDKPHDFTIKIVTWILPKLKMPLKTTISVIISILLVLFIITPLLITIGFKMIYDDIILISIELIFFVFLYPYLKIYNALKKLKDNMDIYYSAYGVISEDLNYKSVLAEYRNLRLSIENNRTYIEASELFKKEMELIKEKSGIFEYIVIFLYGLISDYGESIKKPIIGLIILIFITPLILTAVYYINPVIENIKFPDYLIIYAGYLKSVLGDKFYIGNGKSLLDTLIYCLYSIASMIVIGNLYIALRRRLSRK